ncbi:MAG: sigma factor-like helix-turn-helix DNA-binding protein [bacterium]|nr:sigma factor-like helix-turn-helix DNA-binding protein [bacterium]
MSEKINVSFKPKEATKRLLSILTKRGQDVIVSRYGLGAKAQKLTLDAIGKKYNITRERVRQIENHSLAAIRKSKSYKESEPVFAELKTILLGLGGLVSEKDLLNHLAKDQGLQNHFHFLLVIGEEFKREKEDEEFKHRWHVDPELSEKIQGALRKLYAKLSDDELVVEGDLINSFLEEVRDLNEKYKNEEVIKRWLSISHKIGKNPLGEWGRASSPNVNAKGMRDYAFLVIRKHGSPIHFKEVAKAITLYFNKKAHVATTHNELIKDKRFVLVGRGLYALSEWGYMSGVVKDVIRKILEKEGPLTKEKVVEKVLKERYVKENTILVNLQNSKYFKKDKDGRYHNV